MINLNFIEDVHVSNGDTEYVFFKEKCRVVECNGAPKCIVFEEKCLLSTVVAV